MFRFFSLWCAVVILVSMMACNRQSQETASQGKQAPESQPTAVKTAPGPAPAAEVIKKGKVAETMDAGGYTYFLVDDGKEQTWVAVLKSNVAVGQEISYYDGMVMQNFTSNTLNRTFDKIVFSNGLVEPNPGGHAAEGVAAPDATAPDSFGEALKEEGQNMASQAAAMAGGSRKAVVPFAEIHVDKATGENAYTVSEIYEKAAELAGKKVQVRGKVMKVLPKIMGLNWVHIQDGTGNPSENSHDLVVTTSMQQPKEGWDVVTVKGVVGANKDFGAGYTYAVILEQAEISN